MSVGPQDCCSYEINLADITDVSDLTPNELCRLMPLPLLVTGILVQWMREKFSDPNRIESQLLLNYGIVWDPDISVSKLMIDSVYKFKPATTEFRSAILVKRNPWHVKRYGIADRLMGQVNRADDPFCPRVELYTTMFEGTHTLFCISGEAAEAEILATEVYRELVQFSDVVRSAFGFLRFAVTEIGEISILEEATENFVIPVTVMYGAQDTWKTCPDGTQAPV